MSVADNVNHRGACGGAIHDVGGGVGDDTACADGAVLLVDKEHDRQHNHSDRGSDRPYMLPPACVIHDADHEDDECGEGKADVEVIIEVEGPEAVGIGDFVAIEVVLGGDLLDLGRHRLIVGGDGVEVEVVHGRPHLVEAFVDVCHFQEHGRRVL